jgi:hypothetical protein
MSGAFDPTFWVKRAEAIGLALIVLLSACAGDNRTPGQVVGDIFTGLGGGQEAVYRAQHTRAGAALPPPAAAGAAVQKGVAHGEKIYSADECIGPVIMGRCEGTILPKSSYHPTCYGEWLGDRCTGPMY